LLVVSPALARVVWLPLAGMTAAGLAAGLLTGRSAATDTSSSAVALRNPFRLMPALKFGALFGVILFAGKAAAAAFGSGALYWTSALGGSLDVDAVSLSLADLLTRGTIAAPVAAAGVLLALFANALIKTAIAVYAGASSYARSVAVGFGAMFAAGLVLWYFTRAL